MLNLKRLQYLDAIYRCKNFTQASEMLYVSQPAISGALNTLEEELGVKLVVRNSKSVTFTYEGEQFMVWVRRILSLCRETENAMQDLSHSAEQRLRLGVSHVLMIPLVPKIYSTFMESHPQAQIYMTEGSMKKHLAMVRSEQVDLAYNALPEERDAEDLRMIPLTTMEVCAVLHPEHPLAQLERIPIPLLSQEKLIMMDDQAKVTEAAYQAFERHHMNPNVIFNYNQVLCMVDLVKACRYVGIIGVAHGQTAPGCDGLVLRPFEDPVVFRIGFFSKKGRYLPKLGWWLIDFVKKDVLSYELP